MKHPTIDPELLLHDLETLGAIGADPHGGVTRIAFDQADQAGRTWVAAQMQALGMTVTTDAAGNTIGYLAGTETLPAIAIGSHTDTVAQGGRYDGALGVLAGVACVRALREVGAVLRHPIEVINFVAEEATLLGTLGSRAMVGELTAADLEKPGYDGRPVATHQRGAGIDPARLPEARRAPGELAAYLELHIEQGDQLESDGLPIGLVEGIVGIRRYSVIFAGQANHAGTTQMARRRDALVAAAGFVLAVRDLAVAHGVVGTTGTLNVAPNVPNVIPGRVELSCEIRSLKDDVLDLVEAGLARHAEQAGARLITLARKEPVAAAPELLDAIAASCDRLGLAYRRMPSGAGHDAMSMASIAPQAMIFVPSQAGISHAPDEYSTPEQCAAGARVLLETLLELDRRLE